MRNKLMTMCALVVCVPALAFAQAGGGSQGGTAAQNAPRTQQQRQRDSLILHQRAVQGDTGQGNQQGYHGTQALTTPTHENMGTQSDTGQANAQAQQGKDTVTSSAAGSIAPASNQGLSKSDVKQLQTALDSLGCNPGAKDGIIGPKTQQAISCGQQKTSTSDLQQLGQALNLNISPNGAGGNAVQDSSSASSKGAVRGSQRQTGGQNAGRIRPLPKKSDTSTTNNQSDTSSMKGQTGQQGTLDTTTSKGTIDTSFNQRDTTQMNRSDTTQMNRSDTTQMNQRDTTQMNRSDTTQMNQSDTSQLNRVDTTGATLRDTTNANQRDTTMLRDTTMQRDTTMLRDTTRMRDTTSTRTF